MLNLLAIYVDYQSWYDFKKKHLFANEFISEIEKPTEIIIANEDASEKAENIGEIPEENSTKNKAESIVLQLNNTDKQENTEIKTISNHKKNNVVFELYYRFKEYVWLGISVILLSMVLILIFWQRIFATEYTFTFIDADRNTPIKDNLEIKILKDKETPIQFDLSSSIFKYRTQSKTLKLEVTSPFYKQDIILEKEDQEIGFELVKLEEKRETLV